MQAKLNYYSRYNRIKLQDKKTIPSLYSLLSTQTLNKLAHDASVSLQMISLYKKQNHHPLTQQDGNQHEYLQANKNQFYHSVYHSLQEKSRLLSPSIAQSREAKISSSLIKKQKISKKSYLQNLVKEVREKSLERVKETSKVLKQQKKKSKIHMKKTKKSNNPKINMSKSYEFSQDLKADSEQNQERSGYVNQSKPQSFEQKESMIQNKLLKHLLSQSEKNAQLKIVQERGSSKKNKKSVQNFKKEYVESVQDENEQKSKPSVVIERFKLVKHQNLFVQEKNIANQQSKQDNPSSNQQKESQIKSYSKEYTKIMKPTKNLIEIKLSHSQSEIWKPQQRSLEIPYRQVSIEESDKQTQGQKQHQQQLNLEEPFNNNIPTTLLIEQKQQINNKSFSIYSKEQELNEQMNDIVCYPVQKIYQSFPMSKSYKNINHQSPIQFLSQINQNKTVQEAPYQHPLQTVVSLDERIPHSKPHTEGPKKTSFKKFIMNKELNPRLVTSTILNQKNTNNHFLSKDFIKDKHSQKQKQNEEPVLQKVDRQKSVKKNFKKMMMTKRAAGKEPVVQEKQQKGIPLRKLQNKKLLQAFFNEN